MNANDCQDLMIAYVAGCTDNAECACIEALLSSGDITAQAAYAEALSVLHAIPMSIDPIDPPPHLRARVLKRCVHRRPGVNGAYRWALYGTTALAACLAVALTLSVIKDRRDSANWQGVQRVLASKDVTFAKLDVMPVSAGKSASNPGAYGRVLYCPVTKMYEVHVFNLTPPPPGKVYQLWLITPEKKPVPAGTFSVASNGDGTLRSQMPAATLAIAAAITDEPTGGSPAPTGTIQLTGPLSN